MEPNTLATYPWVKVRVGCTACKRRGSYRLARLAAKFGPDISMDDLLAKLADCPYARPRHPYRMGCHARFVDLEPPRPPPDEPTEALRLIVGGKS